eukprot:1060632-Rhodomonas_salina.1
MKLLDKKSFKLPGVREFRWSPAQNVFAAFIPAQDAGQSPARVVIVEVLAPPTPPLLLLAPACPASA